MTDLFLCRFLQNAPTQSLLSVVNGILEESVERRNGEIPHVWLAKWKYKYISMWLTCTLNSYNRYIFINILYYFCLFSVWHACWERFHRRLNGAYRLKQNIYELYVHYIILINYYLLLVFLAGFLTQLSYTSFSKVIFLKLGKKNINREYEYSRHLYRKLEKRMRYIKISLSSHFFISGSLYISPNFANRYKFFVYQSEVWQQMFTTQLQQLKVTVSYFASTYRYTIKTE
jgi:hypothetical protein